MPDRSEALHHSACRQSLLQIEDVHFGEPGAVGLLLEDTDGISRQLRRLAGLVGDGERPARFLIREVAVMPNFDDLERVVLPVSGLEALLPELADGFPAVD